MKKDVVGGREGGIHRVDFFDLRVVNLESDPQQLKVRSESFYSIQIKFLKSNL